MINGLSTPAWIGALCLVTYAGSIFVLEGGPTRGLSYSRSVTSLRIR